MRYIKWSIISLVLASVIMGLILFFLPAPSLQPSIRSSRAVYDVQHHLLRLTLSEDSKYRLFTPLAEISPQLIKATLLQEDQYFYWHIGVNPISLIKASWQTYGLGSRRVGASTITMQVARLRFGMNSKTLSGKLWQIIRALQLEVHYSKNEILEAYLNLAPYGNNIEGVGAASFIYFNKSVSELSLPEALTLAVIPQNPTKRTPAHTDLKEIRNKLYLRWLEQSPQDESLKSIMSLPLQIRSIREVPFLAPHFVNEILQDSSVKSEHVATTLEIKLQKIVERVTQNYLADERTLGINNAAVMLVDTRDMSVKALLGSGNFFNTLMSGQIDGTLIKRSPGSTLKPFIYALAIDQGLIHPATVLKDVPRSFGSYNPENFDNEFIGPIKAKDALVMSRNIPAIYLANQLKNPSLYEFLQQANVSRLKAESFYGLALVLGGAEVSMQELVTLYAALVNNGLWRPLRFMQTQRVLPGKRLLSAEASFLVMDMLKAARLPNANYVSKSLLQKIQPAWKTGTSSGYRDAWTIGAFGPYVLAVWIGNFNNQSNPALIGHTIAAPLFLKLMTAIAADDRSLVVTEEVPKQLNLTKVEICKASGMLPTRYCKETEKTWFIPGKSPIKTDTVYREIAINSKTGLRACRFDANTRFEIFEFWPSDVLKIFQQAGVPRRMPPPYESDCTIGANVAQGFAPQISSPQNQVVYVVAPDANQPTLIPFTAVVDADVKNLYWFIDETFLGKITREKSFFWHAKPGNFVIRVVDDFGRSDARDLKVQSASSLE